MPASPTLDAHAREAPPAAAAPIVEASPNGPVPRTLVLGILASAVTVIAAAVIAARFSASATTRAWFDNVHWTIGYSAGAALAWLGVRHAPRGERSARSAFATGLTSYAFGQVLWDVQVASGWNPFPAPSDAFYLVLGPACVIGLAHSIASRITAGEQRVVVLDVSGLAVASLAFVLATYLPLRGDHGIVPLAVLVAYPAGLLTALCVLVVMIPALRLKPDPGGTAFLAGLALNAWLWMTWNARTLAGTLDQGSLYNATFSIAAILMGVGALWGRPTPTTDPRWERRMEGALRLLPLLLVVGAAVATIVSFTTPGVSDAAQLTTGYAAVIVVLLALLRQHVQLHERDRLLETRDLYGTLFESAQDAILLMNADGFVDCNASATRMYGVPRDELCRMGPIDFSPRLQPDGRRSDERAREYVRAALAGDSQRFAWRHVRRDGSAFDTEVSLHRVPLARGALLQAIVRDVTERTEAEANTRRLEEQLRHAARLESVGRLAGGVAHDFNNILTVILGTTELAMRRPLDEPTRKDLGEVRRSAQRAAALTAQLLAFSRKQVIAPVALDLNALVGDSLEMLRRLIGEDVELDWRPGRGVGTVLVDPTQMEQVLVNLAVNARDAMPAGGRLVIATRVAEVSEAACAGVPDARPGRFVQLEVRDNGPGIAPEIVDHLFEPFFTTKSFGRGTGLGLSTVYGIVRQSDGFIAVESSADRGACFRIHLPEIAAAAIVAPQATRDPLHSGREHILLVEDETIVRDLTQRVLSGLGYRVTAAESGEDALRKLDVADTPVDLLLTDVIMPHMSGRELHMTLDERFPGLRVVYMSGYTDNIIAPHGVLDPGMHFLQKPFTLESLAGIVRSVLDARDSEAEQDDEAHAA